MLLWKLKPLIDKSKIATVSIHTLFFDFP